MIWQYSPYFIAYIACGLILLVLGITGWRNRTYVCARSASVLMFAAAVWAFCTALELASADLPTQMLAITLEYPAMVVIPVGWLLFALEYSGRDDWITGETIIILCIVPVITVVMVATNGLHGLFYTSVTQEVIGGLSYHIVTYGPAFWVHTVYSYFLIALALLLILQRFLFSSSLYRGQVTTILVATILPLVMNLVLIFRFGGVSVIDPTPFALLISGFILLYGMIRFQLLDITPIAHEQVLENMRDGVMVIDIKGRIVSLNEPAATFLGRASGELIGTPVIDVLPAPLADFLRSVAASDPAELHREYERVDGGMTRFFEMRSIPVATRQAGVKGRIILVRDITEVKQTVNALHAARTKLNLLSSFTRHDVMNQVTALLLQFEIAREAVAADPETREWMAKQEAAVHRIQNQIEFARDYEDLGVKPPQWMSVHQIFEGLRPVLVNRGIALELMPEQIEIFSDPLLARVFANLVDNSLRHGDRVTAIRLRYQEGADGLTLIYEDNGIGIPFDEKTRIFERGTGQETGLGLFLVTEILSITGMTIRESGEPGKGARFAIGVRAGQYRIKA